MDVIIREVAKMVGAFGTTGYIANLGHGMLPTMKPEALAIFVDQVHKSSEEIINNSQKQQE